MAAAVNRLSPEASVSPPGFPYAQRHVVTTRRTTARPMLTEIATKVASHNRNSESQTRARAAMNPAAVKQRARGWPMDNQRVCLRPALVWALLLSVSVAGPVCQAEDEAAAQPALNEVIVTAQKRSENIQ